MEISKSTSDQNPTSVDRLLSPEIIPPVTELGAISTAGVTEVESYKKYYNDNVLTENGIRDEM